jgi:class 3 adenylate cyclase
MAPRIQYVRTSDDVSIACFMVGDGPTLVMPPPAMPFSHAQLEWEIPEWRAWYERLTARTRLVRYDGRGTGLSDRDAEDGSLEAAVRDLEGVADGLGIERFALFGCYGAAPAAIAYAARHPERVSHLLLWCAISGWGEVRTAAPERNDALKRLLDIDYELFTETLAHTAFGWSEGEPAHRMAVYMREATSADFARRCWEVNEGESVGDQLPLVRAPALVMHRRELPLFGLDVARRIASSIPGARLTVVEGTSLSPYIGDVDGAIGAIFEFLGVAGEPPHAHGAATHSHEPAGAFRTILFSDVEDSTGLIERMGDARARELLRAHERIVREALRAHGGSEVKTMGDGFMAAFGSATRAVECAIAVQRAMAAHNSERRDAVEVRVGLNAGEPIEEGDDFFGTSVNLAARIAGKATSGEILASDVIRQLVAGKGFLFADRGDTVLRGYEDPVRLYEVRWRESDGS